MATRAWSCTRASMWVPGSSSGHRYRPVKSRPFQSPVPYTRSRGARHVLHDRQPLPDQTVEERRLADVRAADDGHDGERLAACLGGRQLADVLGAHQVPCARVQSGALESSSPAIWPTCTSLDLRESLERLTAQLQKVGWLDHLDCLADESLRLLQTVRRPQPLQKQRNATRPGSRCRSPRPSAGHVRSRHSCLPGDRGDRAPSPALPPASRGLPFRPFP